MVRRPDWVDEQLRNPETLKRMAKIEGEMASAERRERERERLRRCPRPDKEAWNTVEVAAQVRANMRERNPDTAACLEIYQCRCGSVHLGRPKEAP